MARSVGPAYRRVAVGAAKAAGSLTLAQAAAPRATLLATAITVAVGLALLVPSLAWLLLLFQRPRSTLSR